MLICSDCRKRAEKYGKPVRAFDNGASTIIVDNRQVVLKHCESCGKLMVLVRQVQEYIR